jgi:uncharacterized protein (TIGR01777 family)
MPKYVQRGPMPVSAEALFAWHARPGALQRLLPPWQAVRVEKPGGIHEGETVVLRMGPGPLALRWVARHGSVEPGRSFVDEQESGPFARWRHTHRCLPDGPDRSVLEDEVDYELPLSGLSSGIAGGRVEALLRRMFGFRHRRTHDDLFRHAAVPGEPRRVAVTGASGLVGQSLAAFLSTGGHRVAPLVRRAATAGSDEIRWDPARGEIDRDGLAGVDAVVHLAGESIAAPRWSEAKKRAIRDSRVQGTRLLCEALASLERPPEVLVSASAIGIYGDRGVEIVDEESAPGEGFLAEVCREWEAAAAPARDRGIRVVHLRIGVVLSARGGMLAQVLTPFRLGLGGPVGGGKQVLSWISLDDLVGAIHFALFADHLTGPVNAVAPDAVTNREFARCLGRVLRRPAVVPLPSAAVRAALGEMGENLLLGGVRVAPSRLLETGFRFLYGDLEDALRFELGRLTLGEAS